MESAGRRHIRDQRAPGWLLQRGTYLASTVVATSGSSMTTLEKAFEFTVRDTGAPGAGLVKTEGQWQLVQGADVVQPVAVGSVERHRRAGIR